MCFSHLSLLFSLKSIGLILKVFGEPFWSLVADMTDPKAVYILSSLVNVFTLEILRTTDPLTVSFVFYVKIFRTITSCSGNIITAASMQLTEGTDEGYGRQRMFGAIAWGVGAYVAGGLIDNFGMKSLFYYTYFLIALNGLLVVVGVPSKSASSWNVYSKDVSIWSQFSHSTLQLYRELKHFFSNGPCRVVLMTSIAYGVAMTVPDTFIFLSLESDFHASRTFAGWLTIVSICSEIPIFWYSEQIISSLGVFRMILLAMGTCILRLLILSILSVSEPSSLLLLLLLQLSHGLNFGLFWLAAANSILKLSPDGLLTSSMAALNIAYYTCGGSLGNLLWGWVYQSFGVNAVYRLSALAVAMIAFAFRRSESVLESQFDSEVTFRRSQIKSSSSSSDSPHRMGSGLNSLKSAIKSHPSDSTGVGWEVGISEGRQDVIRDIP